MSNIFDRIANFSFNGSSVNSLILVAGKDVDNRCCVESIIIGAGYHYLGRDSLENGRYLTGWENPDLIILDLNVDERPNEKALKNIATFYDVPVLIFSEYTLAKDVDEVINTPTYKTFSFTPYYRNSIEIQKPVSTDRLLSLISKYLYEKTSPLIEETDVV